MRAIDANFGLLEQIITVKSGTIHRKINFHRFELTLEFQRTNRAPSRDLIASVKYQHGTPQLQSQMKGSCMFGAKASLVSSKDLEKSSFKTISESIA